MPRSPESKDIAGAKDNPLLRRYEGSFIVSYERKAFTDFKVPLSGLQPTDRRDGMNNRLFAPKKELELEGAKTRLAVAALNARPWRCCGIMKTR